MKNNARGMILFLIFFISADTDLAQSTLFLNPGLKFGYAFGKNGDFVFGAELSVVYWSSDRSLFYYGAVISTEISKHFVVHHFGIELGTALGGVEAGPSLLKINGVKKFGYGFTAYTGLILIPFYNYNKVIGGESISEIGSFIKIPLLIKGRLFNPN